MNRIIADYEQRQRAIDVDVSVIVRAPAGSGKTELLIQRYLRLLSLVDAPEEIIAITFTRKAAAEMQSRILSALALAAGDEEPDAAHRRQTWQMARAVLKRDAHHDWNLQQNPSRMRIQTIDSLCAGLVRQMPMLSGLGALPETVEDARPLYEQAAINTLSLLDSDTHWSDNIARLLLHLDNDMPRVKQLIMAMLAKRDQWIRHVVRDHQREEMEQALQDMIADKLAELRECLPAELETELCEVAAFAAVNLKESSPEHPGTHCSLITDYPPATAAALPVWRGLVELLLTKQGHWRKQHTVRDGFPPADKNKAEKEIRTAMKDRAKAIIGRLQELPGLLDLLHDVRALPPAEYTDEEWDVVSALCRLLLLAEGQLQVLFAEQHQSDFNGIAGAAITALGDEEAPTDLALMLDHQIKHLLVDEFQDISVNQYRLLQGLTAGWAGGDGHSLFLVGDPMQSIYRFREAEVRIYNETWHSGRLGQVALERLTLSTNFRSQPGLVEWVNTTFAQWLPTGEETAADVVGFEPSIAYDNIQQMHSITVKPVFEADSRAESLAMIQRLTELRQSAPQDSIAILVRSRSHLRQVMPELRRAGLPFLAVDIEGLVSRPEVQDCLALLRALIDPADRTAWLAILRAPWCGLKLADLFVLAGTDRQRTLFECMHDDSILGRLSDDARRRLEPVRRVMSDVLVAQRSRALHTRLESAWLRLGGPATIQQQHQLDCVLVLIEHLSRVSQGGTLTDIHRLLDEMEDLFVSADAGAVNPIQIMTIHKAKGLEFDHVFLPGLGRKPPNTSPEMLRWMQFPRADLSIGLVLAPIRETGRQQAPLYDYLSLQEKRNRQQEDDRLLYVAVTRAKKSLCLSGHARLGRDDAGQQCLPAKRSFLERLWPRLETEYRNAMVHLGAESENLEEEPVDRTWQRFSRQWSVPDITPIPDWIENQPTEQGDEQRQVIEFDWAGEHIKHVGTVVHRAIQRIAEEGIDYWDSGRIIAMRPGFMNQLRQLGVKKNALEPAAEDVCKALQSMIDDERGQWILDPGHQDACNELALTGLYKGRLTNIRIDRTFIDRDGVRWIIDYKTSPHRGADTDRFLDQEQERYCGQMEKYAVIMRGMENKPIRLGLYFPLLQGWRYWDAPPDN